MTWRVNLRAQWGCAEKISANAWTHSTAWYWPCGWMFKCLGWPCPATFIFLLFETPIVTLCFRAPRNTCCGNACFGAQVSSKYGTWYSERVILQFMCVGCQAGVTYLRYTVLTSPKKGETAVHCCDPTLSVLVMLVSRNVSHVWLCALILDLVTRIIVRFSRSINLAVHCLSS